MGKYYWFGTKEITTSVVFALVGILFLILSPFFALLSGVSGILSFVVGFFFAIIGVISRDDDERDAPTTQTPENRHSP
jgi:hypothetical protein